MIEFITEAFLTGLTLFIGALTIFLLLMGIGYMLIIITDSLFSSEK